MNNVTVAFVGLGAMGLPMAKLMARSAPGLRAYDLNSVAESAVETAGATIGFASAGDACTGADIVVTMLPGPTEVESVLCSSNGVFAAVADGAVVIDMSTTSPEFEVRMADAASICGVRYMDAPVSGGTVGAAAGQLSVMAGGDETLLGEVQWLLDAVAKRVFLTGGVGTGQGMKLVNNLISAVTVAAVGEAFSLARRSGLDLSVLHEILTASTADCWALRTRPPEKGLVEGGPAENDFAGGFATRLMCKDLDLVRDFAADAGSPVVLAGVAHELFRSAVAQGFGEQDFSVVAKVSEGLGRKAD